MPRPKHTRKDANHAAIVNELRNCGYTVIDVSNLPAQADGAHPLDLFVLGYRHSTQQMEWLQCEIKANRKARFTESEEQYLTRLYIIERWVAVDMPILCITCADDVTAYFAT